ncbi:hypothetical protein OG21DRAFT_1604871 [Imleria badia]|nr:hypothetical protein OG21DRAFT_1604871 [Imleria badia]
MSLGQPIQRADKLSKAVTGFGLSVLDEIEGYTVPATGSVVTISLSPLQVSQPAAERLARTAASLSTTHMLVDRAASATEAQWPVLSILAAGPQFPQSPWTQSGAWRAIRRSENTRSEYYERPRYAISLSLISSSRGEHCEECIRIDLGSGHKRPRRDQLDKDTPPASNTPP